MLQWLVPHHIEHFQVLHAFSNTSLLVHKIECMQSIYLLLSLASGFLLTVEDAICLTQGQVFRNQKSGYSC